MAAWHAPVTRDSAAPPAVWKGNPMGKKQLALATCIALAAILVEVSLLSFAYAPGAAQTQRRAALVVQFGDGSYVTRCVSFSEESITGLELLLRSGLQVSLWGSAVCRIEQEGCDYPGQPCFCQCKGSSCQYWSYWHWKDDASPSAGHGGWTYAQIGAGDYYVQNGNMEAWLWGDAQTPPVAISFAGICPPSAVTAAPDETAPASAQGSVQSVSLTQYVVFAIMAIALLAGFWFVRGRHQQG